MSGITITHDDQAVRRLLGRMRELGRNPQPLLQIIAAMGESQTRERFATETDPDGVKWISSKRAQKKGGKTLTLRGILAGSITHDATAQYAQWGTNVVYAAIHQNGGDINVKARTSLLRFRKNAQGDLMSQADIGGKFRNADKLRVFASAGQKRVQEQHVEIGGYKIHMPRRAFLGVNERDQGEFLAALEARLRKEIA